MAWFGGRNIEVKFVDVSTGKHFAQSSIPLKNLPESFATADDVRSTVHIEGSQWMVVRAEPMTSAEFAQTKRLTLWVQAVKKVDPQQILFSLPTICDYIPGVVPSKASGADTTLRLHEDEWRQIEFVALTHEGQIDECIDQIRRIYEQERVGVGFRKCHVRKDPREPLEGSQLSMNDLTSRLRQDRRMFEALSYQGVTGVIEGGFAIETGPLLTLYGQQNRGRLTAFCMLPTKGAEADVDALLEIARGQELCLVDWCRAQKVMPDPADFRQYFAKSNA